MGERNVSKAEEGRQLRDFMQSVLRDLRQAWALFEHNAPRPLAAIPAAVYLVAYIPFSKMMHIVTDAVNLVFVDDKAGLLLTDRTGARLALAETLSSMDREDEANAEQGG